MISLEIQANAGLLIGPLAAPAEPALSVPNWALFLTILLSASLFDLLKRRVPNWLTVGGLCAGLGARALEGGLAAAGWGLLGGGTGLLLLFFPFHRHWVGAGDVKLLAAIGAWLGPAATLQAALAGAVAGGLLSLYFVWRAGGSERREIFTNLKLTFFLRSIPDIGPRSKFDSPPYAVALSVGAVAVVILHRVHFVLV